VKRFSFGKHNDCSKPYYFSAPDLETAIRLFKAAVLFPEECVSHSDKKKSDYNNALERYEYTFKPNPTIPVYEAIPTKDEDRSRDVLRARLPLFECIELDYRALLSQPLLEGRVEKSVTSIVETNQLPAIRLKTEMRVLHDSLKTREQEFQLKMREMQEQMAKLQAELTRKQRVIFALSTYLGMNEEVVQLAEGQTAADSEPLTIYQQLLYMDEEVGVWEEQGIDFNNIELFDAWITKNVDKFLYRQKAVCAFRVRRSEKQYDDNPWVNAHLNRENFKTYFLIRNGDNLYRIYSDVRVPETLFPSNDALEEIHKRYKDWDSMGEKIGAEIRSHLYCFVALQGLIDRTNILGPTLRGKVDLLKVDGFTPEQVQLVRDAERAYWIGDGHPGWEEFTRNNRKTIEVGSRIVSAVYDWYVRLGRGGREDARTYPFRSSAKPALGCIYEVDEEERGHFARAFIIHIRADDTIYSRDWRVESHSRKRRIPFQMYSDEMLNFDAVTAEDCEYYMHNRNERRHYLRLMPTLHWLRKAKLEERALEVEFVKLIQARGWWSDAEVWKAISWWKLKNKWKRALTKDDAKALRMIEKRLQNPTYMDRRAK
jgi:hypothetical protein